MIGLKLRNENSQEVVKETQEKEQVEIDHEELLSFKVLEKGTILYHERQCPFPHEARFSSFPYTWYQTKKGFWTDTSLEDDVMSRTMEPNWRYAYRTKKPIRLFDLNGDDDYTKIEDLIRRRIPEFPRAFTETSSDYPMTAGMCQILGYNGYADFETLRSGNAAFVVLCGSPEDYLEHIQTDAINMSKDEAKKKKKDCGKIRWN
jgi:hypothetical protein